MTDEGGTTQEISTAAYYTSYAFSLYIDTSGVSALSSSLTSILGGASWYPYRNGVCLWNTTTDFGGFCYVVDCTDCEFTTYTAPTGDPTMEIYSLTDGQMYEVENGTYLRGDEVYD